LLESSYARCLAHELRKAGVHVRSEVYVALDYDGLTIENAYRIDQLVEESLILELESVDETTSLDRSRVTPTCASPRGRRRCSSTST
jgi:GxxExxY protein